MFAPSLRPLRSVPRPDDWWAVVVGTPIAVSLVVPRPVFVVVLVVAATLLTIRRSREVTRRAPYYSAGFATLITLVALTAAASLLANPITGHGVRLLMQMTMVAWVVWALGGLPPSVRRASVVGAAAGIGAVAAGTAALLEVGLLGARRADGAVGNAIVFGDLALVFGAVAWMLLPRRTWAIAAAVGAVTASVLSASRGGWLAIPILVGVALVERRRRGQPLHVARLAVGAVALLALAVTIGGGVPVQRLVATVDDVTRYVGAEPPSAPTGTSVGARFEAWRAALDAFSDRPALGVGWGNLQQTFADQVSDGGRHPRIATFTHAHHQLLGTLASSGIVGATALVALLAIPFRWCWRVWRRPPDTTTASATAASGLMVLGGFAVFGLTEAILDNVVALGVFGLLTGWLLHVLDDPGDEMNGRVDVAGHEVSASPGDRTPRSSSGT